MNMLSDNVSIDQINQNLVNTSINLIGNRTTICQIVHLIAYLRHIINNNTNDTVTVKVGNNVANDQLLFDVNGLEIPDLINQKTIEIN